MTVNKQHSALKVIKKEQMESFWHSMKGEETHGQDFANRAEAARRRLHGNQNFNNTVQLSFKQNEALH